MRFVALTFLVFLTPTLLHADESPLPRIKAGLQKVGLLIGTWKGTGEPLQGTTAQRREGFWIETSDWQWRFKDKDAWFVVDITKGKHFTKGELRYDPAKDTYQLSLTSVEKKTLAYVGKLEDKQLVLERSDPTVKEKQRIVFHLLHDNRQLMRYETKPAARSSFRPVYRIGNTKKGVAFATGDNQPECIVSGGLGTIRVMHKGKTYYVCCSGCRDAFLEEPATYVQEYEAEQAKKQNKK